VRADVERTSAIFCSQRKLVTMSHVSRPQEGPGSLAIFYRDFGYASGLVNLGTIESGIEEFAVMSGDFTIAIEPAR
jgi:Cyclophilin-like family